MRPYARRCVRQVSLTSVTSVDNSRGFACHRQLRTECSSTMSLSGCGLKLRSFLSVAGQYEQSSDKMVSASLSLPYSSASANMRSMTTLICYTVRLAACAETKIEVSNHARSEKGLHCTLGTTKPQQTRSAQHEAQNSSAMRDQRLVYSCGREQGAGSLPFHVPGTVVQLNEFTLASSQYPCLWIWIDPKLLILAHSRSCSDSNLV